MNWDNYIDARMEADLDQDVQFEPYLVTCARCGLVLMCDFAVVEEGDEWECLPCWERLEQLEKDDKKRIVPFDGSPGGG